MNSDGSIKVTLHVSGYLVCRRDRNAPAMFFATKAELEAWVNEDYYNNAFCEYVELTDKAVTEMLMARGYSTYAFRKHRG